MSVRVKCSHCQASCVVADEAAGRKVRCPHCRNVFQPRTPAVQGQALTDAPAPAPPPRRSGDDLIPPPKRARDSLIPPPPDGPSVKKTPSFVEREARGLVVVLIVGGITFVIMTAIISVIVGVNLFRTVPQGNPFPQSGAPTSQSASPAPRDRGPPP